MISFGFKLGPYTFHDRLSLQLRLLESDSDLKDKLYEETFKAPTFEIERRRNFAIISHPDAGTWFFRYIC